MYYEYHYKDLEGINVSFNSNTPFLSTLDVEGYEYCKCCGEQLISIISLPISYCMIREGVNPDDLELQAIDDEYCRTWG